LSCDDDLIADKRFVLVSVNCGVEGFDGYSEAKDCHLACVLL